MYKGIKMIPIVRDCEGWDLQCKIYTRAPGYMKGAATSDITTKCMPMTKVTLRPTGVPLQQHPGNFSLGLAQFARYHWTAISKLMCSIKEEYIRDTDVQAMHDVVIGNRCAILDWSQCLHVLPVCIEERVSLKFSNPEVHALIVIDRSRYLLFNECQRYNTDALDLPLLTPVRALRPGSPSPLVCQGVKMWTDQQCATQSCMIC